MSDAGPHSLEARAMILTPKGDAVGKPFGEGFFEALDSDFDGFHGHVLVMTFAFETAWTTWEVHPAGDEFIYLLEGDTDFVLRTDGGDVTLRVNQPGSYVVVPKGTWHTARPHAPTRMLFVTPGAGTLNAEAPPG